MAHICFDVCSLALVSTVFSDCPGFSWGAQNPGGGADGSNGNYRWEIGGQR